MIPQSHVAGFMNHALDPMVPLPAHIERGYEQDTVSSSRTITGLTRLSVILFDLFMSQEIH